MHKRLLVSALLGTCVVAVHAAGAAEPATQMAAKIKSCVEARHAADLFSGVVRVMRDGRPLFEAAYGTADPATGAPIRMDTKFNLASTGKMFTAVAIGQLVDAGKLRFDDPVGKHVKNLPPEVGRLTLHQLLTHSSGLGGYFNPDNAEPFNKAASATELVPLALKTGVSFEPGARWQYSNTGFVLLGAAVEAASGQRFMDYVRDRIHRPLGLTKLVIDVPADAAALLSRAGSGGADPNAPRRPITVLGNFRRATPAGGFYGEVGQMSAFAEAMRTGKLVSKATLDTLWSPHQAIPPGGPLYPAYGYGFMIDPATGEVGHTGSVPGQNVEVRWSRQGGWSSTVLGNYDSPAANVLNDAIGDILDGRTPPSGVCDPPVRASAAAIAAGASGASIGQTPTPTPTQAQTAPSAPPPTEAQIAASPAAKRLQEAIEAVARGDEAIRAFVAANAVPRQPSTAAGPQTGQPPLFSLLNWRYRSQGFTLLNFTEATPTRAVARVRNNLTQEVSGVSLVVEAEAPHRIVTAGTTPIQPQPPQPGPVEEAERLKEIGTFIDRLANADAFSGVVLIARGGQPIFQKAYGYADREKRIPNRLATRFRMASMTKIFTAFAIARLIEQGKLSYEDPLSKFVPDFPNPESAKKIKIKHLLSHTSGLGGYFNPAFWQNVEKMVDVPSVLAVAGREPPQFEPGTGWRYSNTGFHLLGRIIEVVTGKDYFDYMDETMFKPLGLKGTGFPNYDRAGPDIALPYDARLSDDGRLEQAVTPVRVRRGGPAGDGATTAPDLLRFSTLLQSGKVVKPETLRLHSKPKPEFKSPTYGYGTVIGSRVIGRDIFGHGGDTGGTCTEFSIARDTPSPYTVIILSNSSTSTCHPVTRKIHNTLAPVPASK